MGIDKISRLKEPWELVEGQSILNLNNELKREMSGQHPLAKKSLNAVARSEACDDVLYQEVETQELYLIHLTWSKENNDKYPRYKLFAEYEDFFKYCKETVQFNEDVE